MSISYESTGRTRQKQRTRAALVDAARDLFREGTIATVEEAADAAGVSRATAYRYFPNQRVLLLATQDWAQEASLVPDDVPYEAEPRLLAVVERMITTTVENEAAFRAMLRLALGTTTPDDDSLTLRRGRRATWIADALDPLRGSMDARAFKRLVNAIASATGIEALVWLTDVAGLPRAEAVRTIRFSALSILRGSTA